VTFAAGEQAKTVDVAVNGDGAVEPNETLTLTVKTPTGAIVGDTTALGTIVNDDGTPTAPPSPSITIGDATVIEADGGTQVVNVPVALSAPSATPVSVTYATAASTATAPSDFTAIPSTVLTFAPGETAKNIPVAIVGDEQAEKPEKLGVKLSGASGATVADTTALVNVLDDDAAIVVYAANAFVAEGNSGTTTLAYVVSLSTPVPTGQSVSVKVATSGGNATAGTDYVALPSTTVTFAAGEQTKTVNVTVNGDGTVEKSETVNLTVKTPTGAGVGDTAALGTIANDD
jgi:chitinase